MRPTPPELAALRAPADTPWTLDVLGAPDFNLTVHGVPAPQGSKTARPIYRGKGETRQFTGGVALVESSKKVGPWRDAVAAAATVMTRRLSLAWEPLDGPLIADMVFTLPKGTTLPRWKAWHDRKPDLSKLARSTEDALTKIVWADDARVTAYRRLDKVWVGADDTDTLPEPGAVIRVWRLPAELLEARKTAVKARR